MEIAESRRAPAPPIVIAATLALAGACWAAAAWLMNGMDMGVATRPGSFGFFAAAWVTMMAAMMLPGAAPAVTFRWRWRSSGSGSWSSSRPGWFRGSRRQ